ncbi:50S ribosomal protein L6 [Rhodobaculum claviforme]|uniref:Large ribosomal subunit protein uL6 n=1 Tax=Rhodobaculum claviforme TaxID=1549854 RepID=A0A934TKX7_9RHOB|nr:50S ribosomal protein L6 [Rhodobaculum claviforme]MBK5927117.1 50S ribosomal protein L6 [Rhodobaculum claviforme]
MSRIGKRPVELPKGVTAEIKGQTVQVKGPKGTRSFTATDDVDITMDGNAIVVRPRSLNKVARQQWGMSRTMVANLVTGVTDGFKRELELVGVGYRATMQGKALQLALGYSHPVVYEAPEGVTLSVNKNTEVTVEGIDQQVVGEVAAEIRNWRRPEPYKGKGIRYKGEYIFRKEGKKK